MCYNRLRRKEIFHLSSDFKRRSASLIISLIIHGVCLYFIFTFKVTYKIFPKMEEVTDVVIVPPIPEEKLFLPGVKELFGIEGRIGPFTGGERSILSTPGAGKVGSPAKEVPAAQLPLKFQAQEIPGIEKSFSKKASSEFQLALPLPSRLNLAPPSAREKKEVIDLNKYREKRPVDLSRYSPPALVSAPGSKGSGVSGTYGGYGSSGGYGRSRAVPRGKASLRVKNYNISPWANEVVNRIQKSWLLPAGQAVNPKGEVAISVVVERNGEVTSLEVVMSSGLTPLDEAALEAIKVNSPFPPLPPDFPEKNLEALFLFQYGD